MQEIRHKTNVGPVILGLLNGLKHTPETLGPVLGIEPEKLKRIIQGQEPLSKEIEEALITIPGINQRDFYPAESQHFFPMVDDTERGVVIFRKEDTVKSQRTISRGFNNTPYYIYADTAMSNLSTFRPEWIKQLYVNDGKNANSLPDWAFNKGHFEHQVTYFIGPVNFHWKDKGGKKYVCQMNTGDTNYIVPFVPHSFSTRKEGEGLILAVTYGGAISNPEFRQELSLLEVEEYIGNTKKRLPILASRADRLRGGVEIAKHPTARASYFLGGDYEIFELISPVFQPDTMVREIFFDSISFRSFSEHWGFVLGSHPFTFQWGEGGGIRKEILNQGDSFLVRPKVSHDLMIDPKARPGQLVMVNISPEQGDPYAELALIEKYVGEEGLKRVHTETTRWY